MRLLLATIEDVPELLDLQRKAFGPQCRDLHFEDAPPMTETLEHAYEEFAQCITLKAVDENGRIVRSVRQLCPGMEIDLRLSDGSARAAVRAVKEETDGTVEKL